MVVTFQFDLIPHLPPPHPSVQTNTIDEKLEGTMTRVDDDYGGVIAMGHPNVEK